MKRMILATVLMVSVMAVAEEKVQLLTANGLANEKYSEYKKAPVVELEGAGYYAVPAMQGEKGTAEKLIPFRKGTVTNGDSTSSWKRKPGPYTYWAGKPEGNLYIEFKQPCRVTKVRVRTLFSKTSKWSEMKLFAKASEMPDDDKAPEPLGKIDKPKANWNEIKDLDVVTDGLRLYFKAAPKMTYIHILEIEVWGTPKGK
jgi:hypothetical protein